MNEIEEVYEDLRAWYQPTTEPKGRKQALKSLGVIYDAIREKAERENPKPIRLNVRQIDANALKAKFALNVNNADDIEAEVVVATIDGAPTIDTERHGEWIPNTDDFTPAKRCSACGYNKPLAAGEGARQEPDTYCPNCGTKMKAMQSVEGKG